LARQAHCHSSLPQCCRLFEARGVFRCCASYSGEACERPRRNVAEHANWLAGRQRTDGPARTSSTCVGRRWYVSATLGLGIHGGSLLRRRFPRGLTFDMRGGRKWAKPACGRPLDGRVRPQFHTGHCGRLIADDVGEHWTLRRNAWQDDAKPSADGDGDDHYCDCQKRA
jgi:hypothetical protein